MADASNSADLWLPIYGVLDRLETLDGRLAPWVALPILRRLAEARKLRARGRRCDETGRPYGDVGDITATEWAGLEFAPALMFQPHSGRLHDRTAKHCTVYAEVELSGADLAKLWRCGAFQQPGSASAAIPPSPTPRPAPSSDHPPSSQNAPGASARRVRQPTVQNRVLGEMRNLGLAAVERIPYTDRPARFSTSKATADRALAALRKEPAKLVNPSNDPSDYS